MQEESRKYRNLKTNKKNAEIDLNKIMFDFKQHLEKINVLCREYGIARFEIFGSALRKDFGDESDVDCLIDFVEDGGNYFERYFDFKYALEKLFGRKVDLTVEKAIRNPYFKKETSETKQVIYAA
jgi:predicted nucleotidyltransferase